MVTLTDLTAEQLNSLIGQNIRDALTSEIDDPIDAHGRQLVYDEMPHVKGRDFDDYPFIHFKNWGVTTDQKTVDARTIMHTATAEIDVWGLRDSLEDKQNVEDLVDQIHYNFMTGFGDAFADVKMANVNQTRDSRFPDRTEADEPIIVRELTYEFDVQVVY